MFMCFKQKLLEISYVIIVTFTVVAATQTLSFSLFAVIIIIIIKKHNLH